MNLVVRCRRFPHPGILGFLLATAALCTPNAAQAAKPDKADKAERREMKKEYKDATGETRNEAAGGSGKATDDNQDRMLAKLREQFQVADDAEWEVIGQRVARVWELRRAVAGSTAALRGGAMLSDRSKRPARAGASVTPEQDALRVAVTDSLPDAEIRLRLARLHEVSRQNEAKLTQAQESLRAVLTVRQEAVAVMAGILPP